MTSDAQKRVYVSELYSGPNWKKRVSKMSDDQITAIYLQHQKDGQKPEHEETPRIPEVTAEPHIDIPPNGRGPHANEDNFEIY